MILVLQEVSPFVGESDETVGYRHCDFCFESACEDIWDGRIHEEEWRRFYLLQCGTCCCEECIPAVEY